jgi:TolB-like protein/Flp pilus assembly protein TadD
MLEPMPTAKSEAHVARRQLERVLASVGFSRNERLARFLRFVVERHLESRDDELKESVIAVEIFGRSSGHDPRQDSIVRTEAGRLRARLSEYYQGEGNADEVVIELPKGGYIPRFSQRQQVARTSARRSLRLRPWLAAASTCLLAALAAGGWWWLQHKNEPTSIAVLPLVNLSQDPASEYFTDGLTGEIIRNLSIIDGLAVRSQTSSFVFKGKPQNVREAGRQLNAEYILEGSALRAGPQLRLNVQFVRVRDDFPVWSGRYDRELTDIFAVQDEISRGIVNSLRLKLGRGRRRYETSTEAYDLYLRARAVRRDGSVGFYEQAIVKDPTFAPAYAGLAATYVFRTGEDRVILTEAERAEEMSRMRVIVDKAIQLDPLLAEAHAAQGMVHARDAQWEQAEKSFRRALELDPNSSLTRREFASNLLLPLGRIEEAVAQVRLAAKADPLSTDTQDALAYVLISASRFKEADAHCRQPCTRILLLQGKAKEAVPILEAQLKQPPNGRSMIRITGDLGYAYALAGRREEAEKIQVTHPWPIWQAEILVALGDKDRAFEALERAIPLGPVRVGRDLTFPELAPLRGDPRLKALRKKVGLPE